MGQLNNFLFITFISILLFENGLLLNYYGSDTCLIFDESLSNPSSVIKEKEWEIINEFGITSDFLYDFQDGSNKCNSGKLFNFIIESISPINEEERRMNQSENYKNSLWKEIIMPVISEINSSLAPDIEKDKCRLAIWTALIMEQENEIFSQSFSSDSSISSDSLVKSFFLIEKFKKEVLINLAKELSMSNSSNSKSNLSGRQRIFSCFLGNILISNIEKNVSNSSPSITISPSSNLFHIKEENNGKKRKFLKGFMIEIFQTPSTWNVNLYEMLSDSLIKNFKKYNFKTKISIQNYFKELEEMLVMGKREIGKFFQILMKIKPCHKYQENDELKREIETILSSSKNQDFPDQSSHSSKSKDDIKRIQFEQSHQIKRLETIYSRIDKNSTISSRDKAAMKLEFWNLVMKLDKTLESIFIIHFQNQIIHTIRELIHCDAFGFLCKRISFCFIESLLSTRLIGNANNHDEKEKENSIKLRVISSFKKAFIEILSLKYWLDLYLPMKDFMISNFSKFAFLNKAEAIEYFEKIESFSPPLPSYR